MMKIVFLPDFDVLMAKLFFMKRLLYCNVYLSTSHSQNETDKTKITYRKFRSPLNFLKLVYFK